RLIGLPDFTFSHFQYVKTNAVPDAPVAKSDTPFPVLIFSHGRGGFRTHNTLQVEELVSHGYIVATIDHPYAASGVIFPDGHLVAFDQRFFDPKHAGHGPFLDEVLPFLGQDVSFTLDQLIRLNQADPNGILTGKLDVEHAAAFGPSLGGIIATEACAHDARLKACLSMDAFIPADALQPGLQQPLMMMSRDAKYMQAEHWAQADIDETQTTIRAAFDNPRGDRTLVWIDGMYHNDFSDARLYTPLASLIGFTGPIDTLQARHIVNAYSLAFFDHYLKGLPEALLDGPAEQFPGVQLETHPAGK
ncbi:carboxylic ester hydrolase, partial [bacterium]